MTAELSKNTLKATKGKKKKIKIKKKSKPQQSKIRKAVI